MRTFSAGTPRATISSRMASPRVTTRSAASMHRVSRSRLRRYSSLLARSVPSGCRDSQVSSQNPRTSYTTGSPYRSPRASAIMALA